MTHAFVKHILLFVLGLYWSVMPRLLCAQGEQFQLVYKFEPNQFVHCEVAHKMTIEIKLGEASQTTYNESKSRKHLRVVAVDQHGNAVLEPMIDHVRMTAKSEQETVVFNSTDGPDKCPPAFQHVLKTIGQPLTRVKVAANGRLLSLGNEYVQQKGGNSIHESDASRNFLVVFPEKPVRIGAAWHDDINVPVEVSAKLKRQITLRRTYRLMAVKDSIAIIGLKTAVLEPIRDPQIKAQLIQRAPVGTIRFDIQMGQIASWESNIDKVVVGAFGLNSSMRAISYRSERRLNLAQIAEKQDGSNSANHTQKQ